MTWDNLVSFIRPLFMYVVKKKSGLETRLKLKTFVFISNCYLTIFPLLKSMVLIFEQNEAQVHLLVSNMRSVLACFMKHEVIKILSSKQF